ncbi:hypothetical protein BV898_04422 [Hypsibius exemplaris]|uniref:Peptidase M12A domain-containing protein n=1 Tax=Hypsibius exemplaris TaxID=2072580 RepID=A0A1W0X2C5_HYPEX|nr:hypothetical protein BV898_04422 [Hypsibius exemplaris]
MVFWSATLGVVVLLSVALSCQGAILSRFANTDYSKLGLREGRVVRTVDSAHSAWPQPNAIPYRLDDRYTAAEKTLITNAMAAITADLRCIQWVPYNNATDFNVKPSLFIGPTTNAGVPFTTCFSFPGLVTSVGTSRGAQKLGIVSGVDGCMTPREIMKYLVNSLGLRDEWRRPGRDAVIRVNVGNVKTTLGAPAAEIVREYGTAAVAPVVITAGQTTDTMTTNFDLNSITMIAPTKYAISAAQPIYTVIAGTVPGNLARLSFDDCRGLQALYSTLGCNAAGIQCADPYNPANPALTVTLPPVTNPLQPGVAVGSVVPGVPGVVATSVLPPLDVVPGVIPPIDITP